MLHESGLDETRLGLDFSYFSVQISCLDIGKLFYRSLSLVSVSKNHFTEVSVSKKGLLKILVSFRVSGFQSKNFEKIPKEVHFKSPGSQGMWEAFQSIN